MKNILITLALIASMSAFVNSSKSEEFQCSTNNLGQIRLDEYKGTNDFVVIPYYVDTIGVAAFCNSTNIKNVHIPNRTTYIGATAFYGCYSLEHVRMSDNIESIGGKVFSYCNNLEHVYMPSEDIVDRYKNYRFKESNVELTNEIKPWVAYEFREEYIIIMYEGTLQESSNLKDWVDVKEQDGLHVSLTDKVKYFRSKK